jgi:hypothetical protein
MRHGASGTSGVVTQKAELPLLNHADGKREKRRRSCKPTRLTAGRLTTKSRITVTTPPPDGAFALIL